MPNPGEFEGALHEFRRALGEEHVRTGTSDLDAASKATIPDAKRPSAILFPGSAAEVAEVVRIAKRFKVPIWPSSRGLNWGYGSATPALEGTISLRLERINRIIEVNEKLAYAVVEPGVTYRQLRRHLDEHHPDLWCDCTDGPPDGSVIGNALDRGLGVTHYADHFGTLCGLEVVLPDGSFLRTGGGPPDCQTWHTHKWGVGPYFEGIFSQSGMGIVTRAGVWLIRRPEAFYSFTFDLQHEHDLPSLVDVMRELALTGVMQSASHLINDIVALSVLTQYPAHLLNKHSRLPDAEVATLCHRFLVPGWSFGGGIQGTKGAARDARRQMRAKLKPLGRITFMDDRTVAAIQVLNKMIRSPWLGAAIARIARLLLGKSPEMLAAAPHIHSLLKGIPSDYFVRHAYFKSSLPKPDIANPDRDDCGLIWFAPIAPMTGEHVTEVIKICKPLFVRYQFDFYAALLIQNPRSMIVLMSIFFIKSNPEETRNAKALYEELERATSAAGYQPYRVSVLGMGKLVDSAPESIALARAFKRAIDPDGILAPGKYGV
ncbi:MAG TPA: FAD-binding oxidoreductase [Nitrospirales bacterium]